MKICNCMLQKVLYRGDFLIQSEWGIESALHINESRHCYPWQPKAISCTCKPLDGNHSSATTLQVLMFAMCVVLCLQNEFMLQCVG